MGVKEIIIEGVKNLHCLSRLSGEFVGFSLKVDFSTTLHSLDLLAYRRQVCFVFISR